jgi:hypothetical protein
MLAETDLSGKIATNVLIVSTEPFLAGVETCCADEEKLRIQQCERRCICKVTALQWCPRAREKKKMGWTLAAALVLASACFHPCLR